jgi:hypothetical protein
MAQIPHFVGLSASPHRNNAGSKTILLLNGKATTRDHLPRGCG